MFASLVFLSHAALAQSSVEDFALGGSARVLSEQCIRLTPNEPYLTGSAWFETPIPLDRPFEMRMSLVLGTQDAEGADGIVFVFHPTVQTGFRGEGMGFGGLSPSLGVEFDTYQNFHLDDPAADHLALMVNGERSHFAGSAPVALPNLEDGARHPVRIVWSPVSGLELHLDGQKLASYPPDVVTKLFGAGSMVYWGMTAGTGRLSNAQDVCLDRVLLGSASPPAVVRDDPAVF